MPALAEPSLSVAISGATVEQPKLTAEQQRELLTKRIRAHPDAQRILEAFNALADV